MQRFLELSGGPVHLRQHGDGDDHWLLVHGLGASSVGWAALAPHLEGRVTAVDLPGFGLSPPWSGNPIETMRTALVETLARIGWPVTYVGNSMGGFLGVQVAATHPDLLSELILVSPATPAPPGAQRVGFAAAIRASVRALQNARRAPAQRVDALLDLTMVDPGRVPVDVRDDLVEAAALHLSHGWAWPALVKTGTALYAELLKRRAFEEAAASVDTPTLVLWGTEDVLVRPIAMRWLQQVRPDWTSVPLPETGHAAMLERPQKVLRLIEDWRAEVARRSRGKGVPRERRA